MEEQTTLPIHKKPLKYGKSALVIVAGAFFFIGLLMGMLTLNTVQDILENDIEVRLPLGFGEKAANTATTQTCTYKDDTTEIIFTVNEEWECIEKLGSEEDGIPNLIINTTTLKFIVAFPFEAPCALGINLCDEIQIYSDDNIAITHYSSDQFEGSSIFGEFKQDVGTTAVRVIGIDDPNAVTKLMSEDMADAFSDLVIK